MSKERLLHRRIGQEPIFQPWKRPVPSDERHKSAATRFIERRVRDDEWVIHWLQGFRTPALDLLMRVFTFLGGEIFNVLLLPVMFIFVRPISFVVKFSCAFGMAYAVGNWVKCLLCTPRPGGRVWSTTAFHASNYACPSTHALGAFVSLPFAWWHYRQDVPGAWVLVVVAALISASRLYLGAHSVVDIVVAALVAMPLSWLVWGPIGERAVTSMLDPTALPRLALLVPIALVVLHPVAQPKPLTSTPLVGDSAILAGMQFGITLGVWLKAGTVTVLHSNVHDWPWLPAWARVIAKLLVCSTCMLFIRTVAKALSTAVVVTTLSFFDGESDDEAVAAAAAAHKKRDDGSKEGRRLRESVLDELDPALTTFVLNVDVPVKFFTYACLGLFGTYGVHWAFYYIGL